MKSPESENERFTVKYIITTNDKRSIEEHASDITLEQTVEVPENCIPDKHFENGIIGIVENKLEAFSEIFPFFIVEMIDNFQYGPPVLAGFPAGLFIRNALKQVLEHVDVYTQIFFDLLVIHNSDLVE